MDAPCYAAVAHRGNARLPHAPVPSPWLLPPGSTAVAPPQWFLPSGLSLLAPPPGSSLKVNLPIRGDSEVWEMMEDAATGFGASLVPVVHVGTMAAAEIAKKKKKSQKKKNLRGVELTCATSTSPPSPPPSLLLCVCCTCVNSHLTLEDRLWKRMPKKIEKKKNNFYFLLHLTLSCCFLFFMMR